MPQIRIENDGPLIRATNYWDSEIARAGKVWISVNAGTIRVLLPPARYGALRDMRAARSCVLSRGPWPVVGAREAMEILWDDGSEAPYALHVTSESCDLLPGEPEPGRMWHLSVWSEREGRPYQEIHNLCHWRRAALLPCLKPWGGGDMSLT